LSRKATENYTASVARLKSLVERLESAQVDVDELESVVRESVELVNVCRSRLRATQSSVDALLAGLQEAQTPAAAEPAAGETPTDDSNGDARPKPRLSMARFDSDEDDPFAED